MITRGKELYGKLYQYNVFGKEDFKKEIFHVLIGNAKNTEMHDFHPRAPGIKYVQDGDNNFFSISLQYALFYTTEHVAEHAMFPKL